MYVKMGGIVKLRSTNRSGVTGVYWHSGGRKWRAAIMVAGRRWSLGMFEDIRDAALARSKAEARLLGSLEETPA
jgi:hypothetical protein